MAHFVLYSIAPDQGGSATSLGARSVSQALGQGAYGVHHRFLDDPSRGGLRASIGVSLAALRQLAEAPEVREVLRGVVGERLTDLEAALGQLRLQTVSERTHRGDEEENRAGLQRAGDRVQDALAQCQLERDAIRREKTRTEEQLVGRTEALQGAREGLARAAQEKTQAEAEIAELRARLADKKEEEVQRAREVVLARRQRAEEQAHKETEQDQMDQYTQAFQARSDGRRRDLEQARVTAAQILASQEPDDVARAIKVYTDTAARLRAQREELGRQLAEEATSRDVKEVLRQEISAVDVDIRAIRGEVERVPLPEKAVSDFADRQNRFGNAWRLMLKEEVSANADIPQIWEPDYDSVPVKPGDFLAKTPLSKEGRRFTEFLGYWKESMEERLASERMATVVIQTAGKTSRPFVDVAQAVRNFLVQTFEGERPQDRIPAPSVSLGKGLQALFLLDFGLERLYQNIDRDPKDAHYVREGEYQILVAMKKRRDKQS